MFDILNWNEKQNSSGEAVSAIHKMFKIMLKLLKAAVFKKKKIVDWRLGVGMSGGQACCMWGPGHPSRRLCFY